ncbi:MAG: tRNA (guanosine(37)-N1)-methyltransferase TrmD [Lachnospiraceae bacterium]
MNFHIMTLFPEMFTSVLEASIIGRAADKGLLAFKLWNIRDWAGNKHGKVDDYPYGGGAGMVMQPQPIYDTYQAIQEELRSPARVVSLTPQGNVFTQSMAKEFAREENLVLLCGHYEGIDERVQEEIVTDYVSIGDYVLTGGELPAMVLIDSVSRMIPQVLSNDDSASDESFYNGLLEYPQYSRPEVWHDRQVPPVLLSGHHANIKEWRKQQSLERTRLRRPDLYQKFVDRE